MIVSRSSISPMQLTEANVTLWNVIMSYAGQRVDLDAGTSSLMFAPLEHPFPLGNMCEVLLDGKLAGWMRVESFPFSAFCNVDLDVSDLGTVSSPLSDALQEAMVMTAVSVLPAPLQSRLLTGAHVSTIELQSHAQFPNLQWFGLRVEVDGAEIELTLAVQPDTICAELTTCRLQALRVHPELGEVVCTNVQRLVGFASLTLEEFHELAPGDHILVDQNFLDTPQAVLADGTVYGFADVDGDWTCKVLASFDDLIISTNESFLMQHKLSIPTDEVQVTSEELVHDPVPDLAVEPFVCPPLQLTVSFFLGSSRVPLSEVETWGPGAVVLLPDTLTGEDVPVTVSINGQGFAQGDLVRLDKRLAVRLSRVLLNMPAGKS